MRLEELARAEIEMAEPVVVGTSPAGTRVIVELLNGRFEGRLNGTLLGRSGGDWILVAPDGTGLLDVRLVVETGDGALVYLQSHGRIDLTPGTDQPAAILATTFETASVEHAWLNRAVALTRADATGTQLRYAIYAAVLD